MKRRTLLTGAAAVTAASAFPKPAISANRRKWRLITTWPKNLPGLGTGAQYFADQVTKCTGGRVLSYSSPSTPASLNRARPPQHRLHEQPVVPARDPAVRLLARHQILDPIPLRVR